MDDNLWLRPIEQVMCFFLGGKVVVPMLMGPVVAIELRHTGHDVMTNKSG